MHSFINISNLAARDGWHFIVIFFPVDRLKVSPCIWSPLPVLTLPCLCTAFVLGFSWVRASECNEELMVLYLSTFWLCSCKKESKHQAHGGTTTTTATTTFQILSLFRQEGTNIKPIVPFKFWLSSGKEQTWSPFHTKLKFVGFHWYHKTKPWIPMLANYNNSAANCMELDCVVQNLTTKYIGDWLHNRTNQPHCELFHCLLWVKKIHRHCSKLSIIGGQFIRSLGIMV
jgi:hypothetical protein